MLKSGSKRKERERETLSIDWELIFREQFSSVMIWHKAYNTHR
jgi:hypothetical protein